MLAPIARRVPAVARWMSTAATDAPRITLLRASASYASRGVDLVALQRHMLEAWSPPASLSIDRDWLIASVPLEDYVHAAIQDDGEDAERSTEPPTVVAAAASMTSDSVPLASRSRATGHLVAGEPVVTDGDRVFMSISRRGSVVIVGAPPRIRPDRQTHFNPFAALSHASATPLPRDQPVADEDLQIEVNPTQAKFAEFSGGVLRLRSLDADALRILNSCLAQTVNLQFFEGQLDQMHGTIRHIQQTIQQDASKNDSMLSVFRYLSPSAVLSRARQQAAVALLYQHLAGVNAISNHVVLSGLRTTVRPGSTAWKEDRYTHLQQLLWDEYELERRYEDLHRKLHYVTETIRWSIEVERDAKDIFLERVIVLLITGELIVSLVNTEFPLKVLRLLTGTD